MKIHPFSYSWTPCFSNNACAQNFRLRRAVAKAELMNAGGHIGSHSMCTKLKEKPRLFLTKAHFTQEFHKIAQALRTTA